MVLSCLSSKCYESYIFRIQQNLFHMIRCCSKIVTIIISQIQKIMGENMAVQIFGTSKSFETKKRNVILVNGELRFRKLILKKRDFQKVNSKA